MTVHWVTPAEGWQKCNVDGSSKEDGSSAGCGGVIRDTNGLWVSGFTMTLVAMDGLSAELWSIAAVLNHAWDSGHRRICLASDSRIAIELITKGCREEHPLWGWVHQIQVLIRRDWQVVLEHTYREGNFVANWLAMAARDAVEGMRVMLKPPESLRPMLKTDLGPNGYERIIFLVA